LGKLRELNLTLESKVAARTAELATSNQQLGESLEELRNMQRKLIDTSRAAGMAEVATNVLHNVGNVLNSVNVSVDVALANVRNSPTQGLQQASTMLRDHESDLASFFSNNPKGKLLVDYLHKLSDASAQSRRALDGELSKLRDHVEHIKIIISAQQSLARSSGMIEWLSLRDLLEETLNVSEPSFRKHGIEFAREVEELDAVQTDRHKLFQILVNLFNNARDALKDQPEPRRIVVTLCQLPEDRFAIEVRDTGSGISPENMARIFNYGFSTKVDGHGFGLHGSACAAMELGGRLTATSDGPGRGATFRLELPRRQQSEKHAA
jgi:C4-dicarboxylate-specific signal transduction histidine kinase